MNIFYFNPKRHILLYHGDCLEILKEVPDRSIDLVFADPPYFLSNDGSTCQSGKRIKVNKGDWDRSSGLELDYAFNYAWLREVKRILTFNGTIFVSGTHHVIFGIGFAMQNLGFKILNDITWFKVNPPPNLSCRYFTHATETIIWAASNLQSKHFFDYHAMKETNGGKQMRSLWSITPPSKKEKRFGRFTTQKPLALLDRIIRAASREGDLVLDPFNGSGTTGVVAMALKRRYIGIEQEADFLRLSVLRLTENEKREIDH